MLAYKGSKYQLFIKKELPGIYLPFSAYKGGKIQLIVPSTTETKEIGEHMTHMQKNQGLEYFCLGHANFHATF